MTTGLPNPARITMALDLCGMEGPWVDIACGVKEPTVDLWETGARVPTTDQLERLADLTEFDVAWFYKPMADVQGRGFICWSRKPDRKTPRCQPISRAAPTNEPETLF